ncbi:FtsX-like permease family protein [Parabacteroides sp. PF5-9]|uniref:ABC transporter permease n=1 Tax=Parabacteroides sp. PF5-9 TaxID=1742404 RepID=UPI002473136C|nr:FtsX-like permease family protein [Parabacteroides sp. PF5-9]MDH6357815.1 putative ABC transport system permease protein [Parabacteroides sp. PF5-9]
MIHTIWKQIRNQWRKNVWITLELLLIFCLVWYMVDYFFVLGYNKSLTSHRDIKDTYMINMGSFSDTHPNYAEAENTPEARLINFRRVVDRIKEHPQVESVALGFGPGAFPALGANYSTEYRSVNDTNSVVEAQFIQFMTEGDYFKVFRYTKDKGKTPVSLSDYDWNDPSHVLISSLLAEKLFPGESAVGKYIERTYVQPDASRERYRIVGVIDNIKFFSYLRPLGNIYIPMPFNEQTLSQAFLGIRTKNHIPYQQFTAEFNKEMSSLLRIGNYYLSSITALDQIEEETDYRSGITNDIRMRTALLIFIFINITLCVLGTFWFRTNRCREEIGVRRAMGANTSDIWKLFVIEGLILLTVVVVPAMFVEIQFIYADLIETLGRDIKSYGDYLPDHIFLRFLITNLLTWLLMAAMVILAIWYPTRQASRINPVDALRDE